MSYFRSLTAKAKTLHVVRFLIVGTVNTSFSYLIYAALLYIGLGYQFANLLALVVGILFSFKTQGHFVFDNPDNRLLGRFVVSWALIYLCTITLIGRIIVLGFDAYLAGALALPFSVALSYLAQKYFVFRQFTTEKPGPNHF
ncbi:MAG: GtrA family protein [Candidatus Nitrotoga sp.]|nr:GtrA family protein [Candidatus Nitrotoga sp.]